MTCSICHGFNHNRKEHYSKCSNCGKQLFFHALRLRDEAEERASPTGFKFLCESCQKEGASASTA